MSIKPPRGIFPSLPGGMDRVLKIHFDNYRGALPPELEGKVPGMLMKDMKKLRQWRNWRSGLKCFFEKEQIGIGGALDDCLVNGEFYIPLDNKTKGNIPKDSGAQYYQTQLDCYNLMLRENDYKIANEGYLVYWYPETVIESSVIKFGVEVFRLPCSADKGKEVLFKAAECLRGPLPSAAGCDLCEHVLLRAVKNVAIETKGGEREAKDHEDNKTE